ncbi:hypothetical protein SAMN02745132_02918 [Enterovibrio nigricans DSM 22720]|uniref:Calx-beta domain-containing protein n=2 Tax=Enterovibrio nigricans TaxID=504469 RepID=A0A1T4V076_9GAMM|nr:hypothetical protein SAMN02745132_02918 [Enterovibrio nigricans DSM 22720]
MKYLVSLIAASSIFASAASFAQCNGNVYSMNAGRGHVGALIDLKENAFMGSDYFSDASDRATINSKARFSSSAMAYDQHSDRIYYSSVPAPISYHMEGAEELFTEQELNALDFHAKSNTPFKLAYYDVASKEHVEVANTRFQILRMAFDPATGELYASDSVRLFKVDIESGDVTEIAQFPINARIGGFTSWGDFEFHNGELLFVTNNRTYTVDKQTAELTLKAFHYVDFVTAVTKDQNGQLLMAAKNQNVSGNINSNWLWRFKPETGEKVAVGIFPTRISALATVTSEEHTCYDATVFNSDVNQVTSLTNNGDNLSEGSTSIFEATLDKASTDGATLNAALVDGSATGGEDYDRVASITFKNNDGQSLDTVEVSLQEAGSEVSLPAGTKTVTFSVSYITDDVTESGESVTFQTWITQDKSDLQTSTVTIEDVDSTVVVEDITVTGLAQESGIFYGTRVTLNRSAPTDIPSFFVSVGAGTGSTATDHVDFNKDTGGFRFYNANNQLISETFTDYILPPNTTTTPPFTLPAGTKFIQIGIIINSDNIREGNETLNVLAFTQRDFSDIKVAEVTIQDDD